MPEHTLRALIEVVIFSVVAVALKEIAFLVIARVSPFSLRKELEEEQNTALGVVLGSMIIGLSMIISAAIRG